MISLNAVIGSIVMYLLTFAYLMVLVKRKDAKVSVKKITKASTFAPVIIILHTILLAASVFLQDIPEIGFLI